MNEGHFKVRRTLSGCWESEPPNWPPTILLPNTSSKLKPVHPWPDPRSRVGLCDQESTEEVRGCDFQVWVVLWLPFWVLLHAPLFSLTLGEAFSRAALGKGSHGKELKSPDHSHVKKLKGIFSSPSWILRRLQPHDIPWAWTTQLSCSQNPNPQKPCDILFSVTKLAVIFYTAINN